MSSWVPMQSNPDIMSAYLRKLGVPKSWSVNDVLSVQEDFLYLVRRPVAALILLFPLSGNYEQHRIAQEERLRANPPVYPSDLFYMKQTINNACGTCALIHAVCNNRQIVLKDGILKRFVNSARNLTAEERGRLLERDDEFMQTMNTDPMPETDATHSTSSDGADLHFVTLIEKNGELYELDGLKSFPIKHGFTSKETFFRDAARVCREFIARDPLELRFSVTALTEKVKPQCSMVL